MLQKIFQLAIKEYDKSLGVSLVLRAVNSIMVITLTKKRRKIVHQAPELNSNV